MAGTMVQQGSVDWGALAKSSFTFSVDMLNRISKANVEVITITVAQAMFSQFNFEADAQKRLRDSLSKLKAFSSLSNALWFGVGMKHIVRSLAETEQGACCVAMCACLSVSYNSFTGGKILKGLCDSSLAPSEYTPSLSQWAALFDVCAGAVAISQFPQKVEGFTNILIPPEMRGSAYLPGAGPPDRIATALLDLAKISKGALHQVVLCGSIECAWLGAVAEWLLSLRVEICDASGTCLYRSGSTQHAILKAQVVLIKGSGNENDRSLATILTRSRTHLLPDGRNLFFLPSRWDHGLFLRGRSTWSGILHDTFGNFFDELTKPRNIAGFVQSLCFNLANYPDLSYTVMDQPLDVRSWNTPKRKRALIAFAVDRLPELRSLQRVGGAIFNDTANAEGLVCDCKMCSMDESKSTGKDDICLVQLARTIFIFLYILSWLAIDESVLPSSSGLMWLYMKDLNEPWGQEHHGYDESNRVWTFSEGVLALFTGYKSSSQPVCQRTSAICGNGICVYVPSLTDQIDSLSNQLQLRVVPGHIQYHDRLYKQINDPMHYHSHQFPDPDPNFSCRGMDPDSRRLEDLSKFKEIHGTRPRLELLVEEKLNNYSLDIAITLSHNRLVSLAKQNDHTPGVVSIGALDMGLALRSYINNSWTCSAQNIAQSSLWYPSTRLKAWSGRCSLSEMDMWTHKPSIGESNKLVPEADEWILIDVQRRTPVDPTTPADEHYLQYIRGSIEFLCGLLISSSRHFLDFTNLRSFLAPASVCLYCLSRSLSEGKNWTSSAGVLYQIFEDRISHVELSAEPLRVATAHTNINQRRQPRTPSIDSEDLRSLLSQNDGHANMDSGDEYHSARNPATTTT